MRSKVRSASILGLPATSLGTFEISVSSKLSGNRSLENVIVSFYLGAGSGSVVANINSGAFAAGLGAGGVLPGKSKGAKEGSWDFNPKTRVSAVWYHLVKGPF